MPVMLKPGSFNTGTALDRWRPDAPPEPPPLPPDASRWARAKRGISDAMNDPSNDVLGMSNPMEMASVAPVAISLIRKASPELLRERLAIAVPEGLSAAARRGYELMQEAIYNMATTHPRVMSHFRRITAEVPEASTVMKGGKAQAHFDSMGTGYLTRTKGIDQVKDRALARGGAFEVNLNPEQIQKITTAEGAAQLAGHEIGGHAVQTLMDPSRADLAYQSLLPRTGYRNQFTGAMSHPSEILSEAAGWKRTSMRPHLTDWQDASITDLATGTNPAERARREWKAAREGFARQGVAEGGWTPTR